MFFRFRGHPQEETPVRNFVLLKACMPSLHRTNRCKQYRHHLQDIPHQRCGCRSPIRTDPHGHFSRRYCASNASVLSVSMKVLSAISCCNAAIALLRIPDNSLGCVILSSNLRSAAFPLCCWSKGKRIRRSLPRHLFCRVIRVADSYFAHKVANGL